MSEDAPLVHSRLNSRSASHDTTIFHITLQQSIKDRKEQSAIISHGQDIVKYQSSYYRSRVEAIFHLLFSDINTVPYECHPQARLSSRYRWQYYLG